MPPYGRRPETEAKYSRVFEAVAAGLSLDKACKQENLSHLGFRRNWKQEMNADLEPRYKAALQRRQVNRGKIARPVLRFEEFSEVILGNKLYPHMRQWVEWMEGPEDHIMIETRPETAKTTLTRNYCMYRLAHDPTMRITYASAAKPHAVAQVAAMREIMEVNDELKRRYGDFKPGPDKRGYAWGRDQFMVAQRQFTPGEAESDYSIRAVGMEGQIEGLRSDLFVIDDADGFRFGDTDRDKIFELILTVIESRLAIGGKLIILTNRWSVNDVPGRIRLQETTDPGLWKIYSTPAIIRERDCVEKCEVLPCKDHEPDPNDWGEVVWPEKFGAKTKKVGDRWSAEQAWKTVATTRRRLIAAGQMRLWNLVYQNDPDSNEEAEFDDKVIQQAIDRGKDYEWGVVPEGSIVICSQDPAGDTGGAATLCLALTDKGPLVVDVVWDRNVGHSGLLSWIRSFKRYRPMWWGIETHGGFQNYGKDREVIDACRPAYLHTMSTNQNKNAEGVGVTSLIPIVFSELIIPSKRPEDLARMQPLINQMKAYRRPKWNPISQKWDKPKGAFDALISLWLAVRVTREKNVKRVDQGQDKMMWTGSSNPMGRGVPTMAR